MATASMGMGTITAITMADTTALQRLLTWLSPAFPVGAFAYSAGLETAISQGTVTNAASLAAWLEAVLGHGSPATDAILLAAAHRGLEDEGTLSGLADLCRALTPSKQRCEELDTTGSAFVEAAAAWPHAILERLPRPCPYPVAVGAIAAAHGIPREDATLAYLTAFTQNQVSVAVRLVPLGQTEGLRVLARLEPLVAECARHAATRTLDDIGTIGYASDIAAMAHETLNSRIFRS